MTEDDWATPPERYLTVPEVAELLRVSKMTIYRLTERGEIRAVNVGRNRRIPKAALDAYLANGGSHY